jgi:hypothetical protein
VEIYRERAHLVAYLTRLHPAHWALDPAEPEWPVICIHSPEGVLPWHIAPADVELFASNLGTAENHWDGVSVEEKYERLARLAS